ncbi:caspase family protein [Agromyces sp. NPDC056523]|uniref:caspase family protein n=1 Tax=Agromyces sp. NPDC056523 TaxID=3345850 RepID=UPI00366AA44B
MAEHANPYHYGVVVGINRYPGGYAALKGPVADARAFAAWLTDPGQGGLPKANVQRVITQRPFPKNLGEARPTKEVIDDALWASYKALRSQLDAAPEEQRSELRKTSRLYLFVAGHGIMPGGGDAALLDAKAELDRPTNLDLGRYLDWFRRDGLFAEVCIFADCCRGFELLAEPGSPGFGRAGRAPEAVRFLLALATSAGELSFEDATSDPDEWRGHFSYALMQGLGGAAADPDTGYVTSDALIAYARRIVTDRTAGLGSGRQQSVPEPVLSGTLRFGPERSVAEPAANGGPAAPPGREARKVVIAFRRRRRGMVELVAPDGTTQVWDIADGPWTVWLYDGTWYVQHAGKPMHTTGFADDGVFTITGEGRDVSL